MSSPRHKFNPVPAHHFTLSQLAKPPGRTGRPTLLTPERRKVIEAALDAEAAVKGVRVSARLLATELKVNAGTAQDWISRIRAERADTAGRAQ